MASLSPFSPRNSGGIYRFLGHFNTGMGAMGSRIAMSTSKLRTYSVSLSSGPSLLPVLTIMTAATINADQFANTGHLGLGRSSELLAITSVVGSLNNRTGILPSNVVMVNGPLTNNRMSSRGSREVTVTTTVTNSVYARPIVVHSTVTMGGSCPAFFRSCSELKKVSSII